MKCINCGSSNVGAFVCNDCGASTLRRSVDVLWFYRWIDGASLKVGAIIRDGKTLYGPCPVTALARRFAGVALIILAASSSAAAQGLTLEGRPLAEYLAAENYAWSLELENHGHDDAIDSYSRRRNWIAFAVDAGGQIGLDGGSTVWNIAHGCTEANTLVYGGPRPSAARVLGTKAALVAGIELGRWVLHRVHAHAAADTIGIAVGGFGAGTGIRNLTLDCGR